MTPNDLIAAFDVLADAPDGVKRLRELVLSLAVRGRLVGQDPQDGTAALTPDLEAPRRRNAKSGSVSAACERFDIPASWKWTTLGEATHDWGSKVPDQSFTYLDVGSIDNLRGVVAEELSVIQPEVAPSRARKLVRPGTVIYSTVRPYLLNIAKIELDYVPEPIASTAFAVLHPHAGLDFTLLYYVLRSPFFIAFVSNLMKGVAYPAISDADLMTAEFPIPPLAEQHRIVARVDELMGLLDRLEAARATRDSVRRAARDAALADLRDAPDAEAAEAAWGRIAQNMDDLFTDPEDVGSIREIVLDLGVRGRLVGPGDESGWRTLRLEDACTHIADCLHRTPKYTESGYPAIRTTDLRPGRILWETARRVPEDEFIEQTRRLTPKPGDVFYAREGNWGDAAVVPEGVPMCLSQRTMQFRLKPEVDPYFFSWLLNSPSIRKRIGAKTVGMTVPHVNIGDLRKLTLRIPSKLEQHRIVTKIDAFMSLCDTLEARLTAARDLHRQFGAAAVHHLDM